VISANGNSNGIVWETDRTSAPTVLRAFDATTLKEIYNTTQNSTRDGIGTGLKFSAPTVADGHVFVGAVNALNVFGLMKPTVAARHVFYRHSAFDKNGTDAAIATDKQALRPGQTATFANYTSFSKGINGIMVDVRQLPGTPSLADFDFRVGNDNNPAAWAAAPSPQITLRLGAGDGHSDRIELVWPDGAIRNEWLQVTVNADAATGLASPDVFYFGNAIGESGNSAADTIVDMNDELAARGDPHNFRKPAEVTNAHDYNRDGRVDATDQLLARHNATNATTALRLIAPPPQATAAAVQALLRRRTARKRPLVLEPR
jgi:hypothetical protein